MDYLPKLDKQGKIIEIVKTKKTEVRHRKEKRKRRARFKKIGNGNECPKCHTVMERRGHIIIPLRFHYKEWDYCWNCKHMQHYEEFKSADWLESERQYDFLRCL